MIANVVLFGWPIIVAILFSKYSKHVALLASIIVGYLLLPEQLNFDLPMLPTLEKHTIPALSAFLILLMSRTDPDAKALPGWVPKPIIIRLLLAAWIVGSFLTVMTNRDAMFSGPLFLPALRTFDAFALILTLLVGLLPFFMARKFLAYPEQHRTLLSMLVIAGALYAFLALYEVRMSPQLNNMIYGFFPHSFLQHIRGDGFRPLVFLNHGLWLSIFFAVTVLAAFGLSRIKDVSQRPKYFALGVWLLFTLVLTKSLGALAITLMFLPVVLFVGVRIQIMICVGIATVIMFYPALRGSGYIPTDMVVGWAANIDPERAGSLSFRLANEDILLGRAQERPIFGWGGFGRNKIYYEFRRAPVIDGYWVYVVGVGGWWRFVSEFGLLCLPAIVAFSHISKNKFGLETSVLLIILVANLIDLIPNATITPITWLVAGAVWGRIELGAIEPSEPESDDLNEPERKSPYTRFSESKELRSRAHARTQVIR